MTYVPYKNQTVLKFSTNLERRFDRWVKECDVTENFSSMREVIFTSRIPDTADKKLCSYIIEQKLQSLKELARLSKLLQE